MKMFPFVNLLLFIGVIIIGISSYQVFHSPEDNPIEEESEYLIRDETDLDIDLSSTDSTKKFKPLVDEKKVKDTKK